MGTNGRTATACPAYLWGGDNPARVCRHECIATDQRSKSGSVKISILWKLQGNKMLSIYNKKSPTYFAPITLKRIRNKTDRPNPGTECRAATSVEATATSSSALSIFFCWELNPPPPEDFWLAFFPFLLGRPDDDEGVVAFWVAGVEDSEAEREDTILSRRAFARSKFETVRW